MIVVGAAGLSASFLVSTAEGGDAGVSPTAGMDATGAAGRLGSVVPEVPPVFAAGGPLTGAAGSAVPDEPPPVAGVEPGGNMTGAGMAGGGGSVVAFGDVVSAGAGELEFEGFGDSMIGIESGLTMIGAASGAGWAVTDSINVFGASNVGFAGAAAATASLGASGAAV
jgi:hypothetical protein